MTSDDSEKEAFYDSLSTTLSAVPHKDRLYLLSDFNARVGRDTSVWPKVLGHHSVGNENSNGSLLLQTCSEHELVITNTLFQQADKYKTTWQHPRSKHWHMLDYVITRQCHRKDVHITRAMRGAGSWSDHRLVRSRVALEVHFPRRHRPARRKKLDTLKLRSSETQVQLQQPVMESLAHLEESSPSKCRTEVELFKGSNVQGCFWDPRFPYL